MRDLYRPNAPDYSDEMFIKTDALDLELLEWRATLPRWLRFDRGHTLENTPLYRRQRNMLAMKFHHLRALIHRPYLCLPWLTRNDNKIKAVLDTSSHRIVHLERVCVTEAQETAHMLHNVADKRNLVEDFPWWQMISCLVCASSILLVMRAFSAPATARNTDQLEILEEDADTCLKVFDALSSNSDAARSARDMLRKLRQSRTLDPTFSDLGNAAAPSTALDTHLQTRPSPSGAESAEDAACTNLGAGSWSYGASVDVTEDFMAIASNGQDWPSEMADAIAWSSRFWELGNRMDP